MNVSYFLLSEGSSPFITTNDNPIRKAAHRSTDQLSISFSDIGVLPTNYDNKRLHRVPPHQSGNLKVGDRADAFYGSQWQKSADGELILDENGMPTKDA